MNKKVLGALVTVALGAIFIGGIGIYVAGAKTDPNFLTPTKAGTVETPQGNLDHYTLDLSVYPDSIWNDKAVHSDWVSYGPATNFKLPPHVAVTVTIKQYDSGEKITNDFFAKVRGTLDGTMLVNGEKVTEINPEAVGHTFTVRTLANGTNNNFFLNVPLPAVPDDQMSENEGEYINAQVVTFTFITPDSGEFIWNCEFPCGDGSMARFGAAMSSQGYMSGHIVIDESAKA